MADKFVRTTHKTRKIPSNPIVREVKDFLMQETPPPSYVHVLLDSVKVDEDNHKWKRVTVKVGIHHVRTQTSKCELKFQTTEDGDVRNVRYAHEED